MMRRTIQSTFATHSPYIFFLSIHLLYFEISRSIHLIKHPWLHYNCSLESSCLPAQSNHVMPRSFPVLLSRWWHVFLRVTSIEDVSAVSRAEILAEWHIHTYLRLRRYSWEAKSQYEYREQRIGEDLGSCPQALRQRWVTSEPVASTNQVAGGNFACN